MSFMHISGTLAVMDERLCSSRIVDWSACMWPLPLGPACQLRSHTALNRQIIHSFFFNFKNQRLLSNV